MRRLIVNADDFGLSSSVNTAVIRAHREGILTTASLMVGEPGFAEAVDLARQHSTLGVGLHLTLLCGHASAPPATIPGLVDGSGRFTDAPVQAGWRYFFRRELRAQLAAEIAAQFAAFRQTGLPLDHVNGHLHLHLHPVVLDCVLALAREQNVTRLRLTRDPWRLNLRLARGRWLYRALHAAVFGCLSARAERRLHQLGIRHADRVFGLLQHGQVNEEFILRLVRALPGGDSELYSHPCVDQFKAEFDALVSPRVKAAISAAGIQLIRYRDL